MFRRPGEQGLDLLPLRVGQQPTVSRHSPSPLALSPLQEKDNYGQINALQQVLK
jgi:hypothetical protein